MKIMVDTNIILDVLQNREPFVNDSEKVLMLCECKEVKGFVSALSVANIVYILRKKIVPQKVEEVVDFIDIVFSVQPLSMSDLKRGAAMKFDDFEDSLQYVCAEKIKADYIVTRNTRDFKNGRVKAVEPGEFLDLYKALS